MIKRWLYGVIPHAFTSVFNPASEKLAYYDILRKEGYSHFPYPFAKAYLELPVEVMDDPQKGLPYVLHDGNKRLYYPREWTPERIRKNYRSLRIEQDPRHAHHYIDNRAELRGRTLLDVGAAEGIFSLDVIEEVKAVYLFECEKQWIEALHATFEPWAEKVTIVQKFVGNSNDATHTTLDRFAEEQQLQSPVFLKMDIEGTECEALTGGGILLSINNLEFAICVYHRKGDARAIASYLTKHGCHYKLREGFIYFKHRLRRGVIRGNNNR